jgi:hypothetical protein
MNRSEVATVASLIRAELKKNGIAARVTSKSYSMGNSVNVTVYNQSPAVIRKIEAFCGQYEAGHFDGMTDCYSYDHSKTGPTAKYIHINNNISDDLRARAVEFVSQLFRDQTAWEQDDTVRGMLYGRFDMDSIGAGFWSQLKPRVRLAA